MSSTGHHIGRGRERQGVIYRAGALGRVPRVPTDAATLEERARRAMSRRAGAYVGGGAGEGVTMRRNRAAFERHQIVPRMLRGATSRDLSTTVLGTPLASPILLAPVGAAALVADDADLRIAAVEPRGKAPR